MQAESALHHYLDSAIAALSLPGVMIGHRTISPGDENALLPKEAVAFAASVVAVRRASGAVRIVARQLLAKMGIAECALPKAQGGAPVWPSGIVGSMSHDSRVAVATVALCRDYSALGIDIEPAEPLPPDLLDLVATPQERARMAEDPFHGRLLFAAKEAVYKAVYPLDRTFLDHHDVEVSLSRRQAVVRNGRTVQLMFSAWTGRPDSHPDTRAGKSGGARAKQRRLTLGDLCTCPGEPEQDVGNGIRWVKRSQPRP